MGASLIPAGLATCYEQTIARDTGETQKGEKGEGGIADPGDGGSVPGRLRGAAFAEAEYGTPGPDTLYGTDGADVIHGHGGNDKIDDRAGNDQPRGGRGADRMEGGAGSDTVYAGRGDDFVNVRGDDSRDHVYCGPGFNTVNNARARVGGRLRRRLRRGRVPAQAR